MDISWMQILGSVALAAAAGGSAVHALLNKRDPPAGLGWVAVCLLFPLAGPALYFFFGINRIQRRARKLQQEARQRDENGAGARSPERSAVTSPHRLSEAGLSLEQIRDRVPQDLHDLARVSSAVSQWQLVGGNSVELLHNGEQVYPRMLEAIAEARRSVYLATYIFETNPAGLEIIDALEAAHRRGVDVRVIVDAIGEIYSLPWASRVLRKRGVPVHRFIQPRWFPPTVHLNLRNHRKILVVDGTVGFTGGMNLGGRHLVDKPSGRRVVDLHCRLTGPIVGQLQQVFLDDWFFVGGGAQRAASVLGESAAGADPASPGAVGDCLCRVITDGPDEDLDKLLAVILGAVSGARQRVWIMTPYFLPPRALIGVLQSVALRGVDVRIFLPEKSDVPLVDWATRNQLWELLERGVRCFLRPPPFAHSKLLVVDDAYVQIGSSNLDPRSLRLNFELAVEIFSRDFARRAVAHCEDVETTCEELTQEDLDARPLWVRLRDAAAWLFSPYL